MIIGMSARNMDKIENEHFEGERALFKTTSKTIEGCLFDNGESPLKECRNLSVNNCVFGWKYPLWYGKNIDVSDSKFLETGRAGIWYTEDSSFSNLEYEAPKGFRRCKNVSLENISFSNASETLWWCENIRMSNCKAVGSYLFMQSKSIIVDNLTLEGDYAFDGCENILVKNSILHTKDAFWNCKNATIEDCVIEGEYLGWNSENLVFINCKIKSHQGLCYIKGLKLIDCEIIDSDLTFEYCSDIDATVLSVVDSIKNPISGTIKANGVKELIRNDPLIDKENTKISVKDGKGNYHEI